MALLHGVVSARCTRRHRYRASLALWQSPRRSAAAQHLPAVCVAIDMPVRQGRAPAVVHRGLQRARRGGSPLLEATRGASQAVMAIGTCGRVDPGWVASRCRCTPSDTQLGATSSRSPLRARATTCSPARISSLHVLSRSRLREDSSCRRPKEGPQDSERAGQASLLVRQANCRNPQADQGNSPVVDCAPPWSFWVA